jgi:hypothetical protein
VKAFNHWTRSAAVLAAMVPLAAAAAATSASAAPLRTATTTDYTTTDYLKDALGLPGNETNPAIEPVTYDHFQWLLQQPGSYAVLIGDPATDARFAARAQDVEAAADAAGVERVYWFNPNLSGNARIGDVIQPNLDIRNPAGITSLSTAGQTTFGYAWLNLVGRYLGNGVETTASNVGADSTRVVAETGRTTVNDAGATAGQSTEVGNIGGGALYDYSSGADADVSDSYFLVYDKDRRGSGDQPLRIVSWVNLTDKADAPGTRADVTTAIATVGGANLATPDQFAWWKSATNARQIQASPNPHQGASVPVLTDADDAEDWRIEQITYPELVHLLEHDKTAARDAVIFFGGTWCTNTRPVLPAINKYAQQNDVRVFNFDTVLDGAAVGGGATSGANPLQSRNTVAASGGTASNNASFIYGELFDHYLGNAVTQYAANNRVTYYRGGRESNPLVSTQRLQVPYLIGYRGNAGSAPHGGVTRQWISDNGDGTYREFMSNWWLVNPQANQLGISTIPLTAPIWPRVNAQLATFSWRTDLATVVPNTGTDADDADYLVDADTATVTYSSSNGGRIAVTAGGTVPISPAALSGALAALGAAAPENLAAARAALVANHQSPTPDLTLRERLTTVAGAWGVAQIRKNTLTTAWTNVAFGQKAVRAAEVFYGGLPGGVLSTQSVTADAVKQGTAPTISIAIANEYGRVPAGTVSLVVKQGGTTVASDAKAVANDRATFTLPALAAGTYGYTLSYVGDEQIAGFTKTGSLTVTPPDDVPIARDPGPPPPVVVPPPVDRRPVVRKVKARKVSGKVAKAPTRRKAGTYKVTIAAPKGGATATGKVKITIRKGKVAKTVSGRLSRGTVTLKVPKLARGTWKVTISWPGDARYRAVSAAAGAIRVR